MELVLQNRGGIQDKISFTIYSSEVGRMLLQMHSAMPSANFLALLACAALTSRDMKAIQEL
jgi:hypothetical protein